MKVFTSLPTNSLCIFMVISSYLIFHFCFDLLNLIFGSKIGLQAHLLCKFQQCMEAKDLLINLFYLDFYIFLIPLLLLLLLLYTPPKHLSKVSVVALFSLSLLEVLLAIYFFGFLFFLMTAFHMFIFKTCRSVHHFPYFV